MVTPPQREPATSAAAWWAFCPTAPGGRGWGLYFRAQTGLGGVRQSGWMTASGERMRTPPAFWEPAGGWRSTAHSTRRSDATSPSSPACASRRHQTRLVRGRRRPASQLHPGTSRCTTSACGASGFLVMELVDGPLGCTGARTPDDPREAVAICAEAAIALAAPARHPAPRHQTGQHHGDWRRPGEIPTSAWPSCGPARPARPPGGGGRRAPMPPSTTRRGSDRGRPAAAR
jgi:hypothetical protein